jgi:hypothetical protein
MKQKIFVIVVMFLVSSFFISSCGISPKQGAPTISNNEILIEIDTFNIWKNVDGDIIELNWSQLLGGIDIDLSSIYSIIDREQFINLIRMRINAEGLHAKIIDNKYIKIWG